MASTGFDPAFLIAGGVIVAVLVVVSVLLYMLDTWATARSVYMYTAVLAEDD